MKISIVTLTYKNWRYLNTAIESVSNQLINNSMSVEYIIVDDGTEDFDYDLINKILREKCPFDFKIVQNQTNVGTVKSFNNAIQHCSGDIIIPLSADDQFYSHDVVSNIAEKFSDPNVEILTTLRVPVMNGKELASRPLPHERQLFKNSKKLLNYLITHGNFISGAATTYRKSTLERLDYFDERYRLLEDYPFYVKALTNHIEIYFMPIKGIKYGMDGISAPGKMNPQLRNDYKKFYKFVLESYPLSLFWKRKILYAKMFSRAEKTNVRNIVKYPEQFLITTYQKITRSIK
ncbi:glycosyltransferase [Enterobacter sp. ENT03]|uniref:glycosyltransferase n=1 Tax=Enterobacter sp. ENT03 TaxID=2854780 RepID=UPI001C47B025|nr:glycosyltransferase [Enterobacter sp. ENT03]MBV7405702.1 glycosyltransferase [Enterobacter sp. ENT03]